MSKRCSRLLKSAKSLLSRVSSLFMDSAQDSDLAPFLGDLSEKVKNFVRLIHLYMAFCRHTENVPFNIEIVF